MKTSVSSQKKTSDYAKKLAKAIKKSEKKAVVNKTFATSTC